MTATEQISLNTSTKTPLPSGHRWLRGGNKTGGHRKLTVPNALAISVVLLAFAWALFPDFFATHSPIVSTTSALQEPGWEHWFGTDAMGRDLYSRVIYGSSASLTAAAIAVAVGAATGSTIGLVAGTVRGATDTILMRFVDVLLSIPTLLLSLSVIVLLGFGVVNAAIAVGVAAVASFARLSRSRAIQVANSDYVEAAYGSGATFWRVLGRHVLPNSIGPIVALAALQFGAAILAISTLSFLGYGAQPPNPEWGLIIAEGRDYVSTAPWLIVIPGLLLVALVLSTNHLSQQQQGANHD